MNQDLSERKTAELLSISSLNAWFSATHRLKAHSAGLLTNSVLVGNQQRFTYYYGCPCRFGKGKRINACADLQMTQEIPYCQYAPGLLVLSFSNGNAILIHLENWENRNLYFRSVVTYIQQLLGNNRTLFLKRIQCQYN